MGLNGLGKNVLDESLYRFDHISLVADSDKACNTPKSMAVARFDHNSGSMPSARRHGAAGFNTPKNRGLSEMSPSVSWAISSIRQ